MIRHATPADAAAIARAHVDSWRNTYRGLMPDSIVDSLSYDERLAHWSRVLEDPNRPGLVLVAEGAEGVSGFAGGGPNRGKEQEYDGELYSIYLAPGATGNGIGRQLVHAVAQELHQRGFRAMIVWALAENPARYFYEHMGGQLVREEYFTLQGFQLREAGYGWPDITTLIDKE